MGGPALAAAPAPKTRVPCPVLVPQPVLLTCGQRSAAQNLATRQGIETIALFLPPLCSPPRRKQGYATPDEVVHFTARVEVCGRNHRTSNIY